MRRILVKFKEDHKADAVKEHVKNKHSAKKLDLRKKLRHSLAELLEIDDDDDFESIVGELHNHDDVHYAQPDHILRTCISPSEINTNLWGIHNAGQQDKYGNIGVSGIDVNVMTAWDFTMGSRDVLVAVLDTGIDINHIDLKDSIFRNTKESSCNGCDDDNNNYTDDLTGWDFADKDNSVFDSIQEDKHGTQVSGVITASGVDSGVFGVAPLTTILPLKFMTGNCGATSSAIEAIEYARKMGVRIVNCSWGGCNDNPALKHHIEQSGMLFVCSAGNEGRELVDKDFFPACFEIPNLISVAAINNRGLLWPMSNYGTCIHLAAPGSSIYTTVPSEDEKSYAFDSGTSLAAPHVSGVAALMLSMDKALTPKEIKDRILKSVEPLDNLNGKVMTGGIVNAFKALKYK